MIKYLFLIFLDLKAFLLSLIKLNFQIDFQINIGLAYFY